MYDLSHIYSYNDIIGSYVAVPQATLCVRLPVCLSVCPVWAHSTIENLSTPHVVFAASEVSMVLNLA